MNRLKMFYQFSNAPDCFQIYFSYLDRIGETFFQKVVSLPLTYPLSSNTEQRAKLTFFSSVKTCPIILRSLSRGEFSLLYIVRNFQHLLHRHSSAFIEYLYPVQCKCAIM